MTGLDATLILSRLRERHLWVVRKVLRSKLSFLFASQREEDNGTLWPGTVGQRFGSFDERCNSRSVVHRAVIDRVAVDRTNITANERLATAAANATATNDLPLTTYH